MCYSECSCIPARECLRRSYRLRAERTQFGIRFRDCGHWIYMQCAYQWVQRLNSQTELAPIWPCGCEAESLRDLLLYSRFVLDLVAANIDDNLPDTAPLEEMEDMMEF